MTPPRVGGDDPAPAAPKAAPVDTLTFDSAAYPVDERYERYRLLYSVGTDAVQTGPDFRAHVGALRLDRVNLYDRHLNDVGHRRSAERIANDTFDHLTITLVLSGQFAIDCGDGLRPIPPGCAMVLDTQLPMGNRAREARAVTLAIARAQFVAATGITDSLHGHFIAAGDAALIIDFVESLIARVDTLSSAMVGAATHALMTLIAAAIGSSPAIAQPSAVAIRDAIRIARVRALVDANLADPGFGPEQVIAQGEIARATLYRAFRSQGGIAGYIRARRLEALRLTLGDPGDQRSFAQMASDVGLKSEAHASRLFLDRFGQRPGEYRLDVATRPPQDQSTSKMSRWQENLKESPRFSKDMSHP